MTQTVDPEKSSGHVPRSFSVENLLREHRLRQSGEPQPDTPQAWAAIEQAVIGKTMFVLLHSTTML